MKKKIEKLDHFGRGITYINEKICFVKDVLPGEVVELEIVKETKKYLEGKAIKFYSQSENRILSTCPYSSVCGGCALRHLTYSEENKYKREKVVELISKIASLPNNIVNDTVYGEENKYRNKVVFHVKDNILGYYKENSNDLIEITTCSLLNDKINDVIPLLNKIIKQNKVKEITIRTSNVDEEIMLKLTGTINEYASLLEKINVLKTNDKIITKDASIVSGIGKYNYYVSPESFFQVNKYLTEKLYDSVKEVVRKTKPQNVLDLYCGTGTIGIYISEYAKNVLGIDSNYSNIIDANKNKILNNVQNISFVNAQVEDVIDKLNENYDLIIVDPPRSGLDKKTIKFIKKLSPSIIIYVSCDPATLARDLANFKEIYDIQEITPFNMFPRTYHVECVCVLNRR